MSSHGDNTTWSCDGACGDDHPLTTASFRFGEGTYCFDCVKRVMDALIGSEAGSPARLEGVPLHPEMFHASHFGGEVAHSKYTNLFDMKQEEWQTPQTLRVYCNACPKAMYLGALIRNTTSVETTIAGCGSCMTMYCMKCGNCGDESEASIRDHLGCQHNEARARDQATAQQFEGLTRGVDYQICPTCEQKVQHTIGCNHMTCASCKRDFCYVCGLVTYGVEHWRPASAVPGDERCLFIVVDASGAAKANDNREDD